MSTPTSQDRAAKTRRRFRRSLRLYTCSSRQVQQEEGEAEPCKNTTCFCRTGFLLVTLRGQVTTVAPLKAGLT
eukprot:512539-Hanusia_phi.AAC.1